MFEEAQNPKYEFDAFFLAHFRIFPTEVDPYNLHPAQKEFIMYLVAGAPTHKGLSMWHSFKLEKDELEKKDWKKEVQVDPEVARAIAMAGNKTVDEYYAEQAEKIKKDAIYDLEVKYGMHSEEDEDEEVIERLKQRAEEYRERESAAKEREALQRQQETMERLFNPPETLK